MSKIPGVLITRKSDIEQTIGRKLDQFEWEFTLAYDKTWISTLLKDVDLQRPNTPTVVTPRRTMPTFTSTDIAIKVHDFEIVDGDVGDPFVLFCVKSHCGSHFSTVYRRFNQFKKLHKHVGSRVGAVLPPESTGPFKRKRVDAEFARERIPKLQEYLQDLVVDQEASRRPYLRHWLGLPTLELLRAESKGSSPVPPEDLRNRCLQEAWEASFPKVSRGRKVLYDTPGEALTKWIVSEVFELLGDEITRPKTAQGGESNAEATPRTKDATAKLKLAYRKVVADVASEAEPRWRTIVSRLEEKRRSLQSAINAKQLVAVQTAAKESVTKLVQENAAPLLAALPTVAAGLVNNFSGPVTQILAGMAAERKQMSVWAASVAGSKPAPPSNQDFDMTANVVKSVQDRFLRQVADASASFIEGVRRDSKTPCKAFDEASRYLARIPDIARALSGYVSARTVLNAGKTFVNGRQAVFMAGVAKMPESLKTMEVDMAKTLWKVSRDLAFDAWKATYALRKHVESTRAQDASQLGVSDLFMTLQAVNQAFTRLATLEHETISKLVLKFTTLTAQIVSQRGIVSGMEDKFVVALTEASSSAWAKATKHFCKHGVPLIEDTVVSLIVAAVFSKSLEVIVPAKSDAEIRQKVSTAPFAHVLDLPMLVLSTVQDMLANATRPVVHEWLTKFLDLAAPAPAPVAAPVKAASPAVAPAPAPAQASAKPKEAAGSESGESSGSGSGSSSSSSTAVAPAKPVSPPAKVAQAPATQKAAAPAQPLKTAAAALAKEEVASSTGSYSSSGSYTSTGSASSSESSEHALH